MQVEEYLNETQLIHRELAVLSAKQADGLDALAGHDKDGPLSTMLRRQRSLILRLTQLDALLAHRVNPTPPAHVLTTPS